MPLSPRRDAADAAAFRPLSAKMLPIRYDFSFAATVELPPDAALPVRCLMLLLMLIYADYFSADADATLAAR